MRRMIVMDSDIGVSTSRPILEKIMIGPDIAEVGMARVWVTVMFPMTVRRIVRLKALLLASMLELLFRMSRRVAEFFNSPLFALLVS